MLNSALIPLPGLYGQSIKSRWGCHRHYFLCSLQVLERAARVRVRELSARRAAEAESVQLELAAAAGVAEVARVAETARLEAEAEEAKRDAEDWIARVGTRVVAMAHVV